MATPCIAVLTGESADEIKKHKASKSWKMNRHRAAGIPKLACTRNARHHNAPSGEAHRCVFLLAEIENIIPSPEDSTRWMIKISRYAEPAKGTQVKGSWPVGW